MGIPIGKKQYHTKPHFLVISPLKNHWELIKNGNLHQLTSGIIIPRDVVSLYIIVKKLRKESGSLIRHIGSGDATSAKFSGNDILVTTSKGKTELRKESGAFIRTL